MAHCRAIISCEKQFMSISSSNGLFLTLSTTILIKYEKHLHLIVWPLLTNGNYGKELRSVNVDGVLRTTYLLNPFHVGLICVSPFV
ncbi:hypothetical protein DICVIV_11117 [Dictyocaulus viviparus]|uniref:Uncharacterized protein n=1 Tax=Dictyocaulus viviparus TaxID=29172 RepID=A0A0D8XE16_DICVI|nr:hypothetical protein DICVIV_11117 [Dictyocaulus viviparus]